MMGSVKTGRVSEKYFVKHHSRKDDTAVIFSRLATLCLILAALIPAGCGFRTVYGSGREAASVSADLSQVEIGIIPDRAGQVLRNALIDRFYPAGRPANAPFVLSLTPVRETLTDLDITRESDSTRTQIRLRTDIVLSDRANGQTLLTRRIESVTSYNILGSEFATRVTREDARRNALADLARQIEQELSLYFARQKL